MITEGEAAIPLETTRCAFRNPEKSKQRSAISNQKEVKLKIEFKIDSQEPRFARHPLGIVSLAPAESILNVIFEIYAVFTCFLTYYKPSTNKS